MNSQTLKSALATDIKVIRNLNPDIIPARVYYRMLFKTVFSGFWKIWLIVSATLAYPCFHYPDYRFTAQTIIGQSLFVGFFLSLLAMLALCQSINFFILFRFHLEKRLTTGDLIVKKLKLIATVFLGLFAFLCALFGSYGDPAQIFLMIAFSFFGSFGATYFLVSMELNRVGLSTLFTIFNEFFHKGKAINLQ